MNIILHQLHTKFHPANFSEGKLCAYWTYWVNVWGFWHNR